VLKASTLGSFLKEGDMFSRIQFKDGHFETVEGYPQFNVEEEPATVSFHDANMEVLTDDVPLDVIQNILIEF
jgi:hypothetical protein